jgi:hypothetical protein
VRPRGGLCNSHDEVRLCHASSIERSVTAQRDSVSGVPVDVQSAIEIARPRDAIAAFASDPDNAVAWYQNIKSAEWKTPKPVAVGSRIALVTEFLGRRLYRE